MVLAGEDEVSRDLEATAEERGRGGVRVGRDQDRRGRQREPGPALDLPTTAGRGRNAGYPVPGRAMA